MSKSKSKRAKRLQVSPHLQKAVSLMSDGTNMFASGGLAH